MVETVLAYIERNDEYLLLFRNKKKNDINLGKWIGVGGHIENGETPEQALIREIKEETNLDVNSFEKRGIVYFYNNDFSEVMHLYVVKDYSGEIKECDEGILEFKKKNEMFNLPMWEGDKYFLKLLLEDSPYFELELFYNEDNLVSVEKIK